MPRVPDGKPNLKALAARSEKENAARTKAAETAAAKAAKKTKTAKKKK